ncbi:MAG: hypothetical protein AAF206_11590 [Bacteroidota bacterium]
MSAHTFIIIGSVIVSLMGAYHLYATYFTPLFTPNDPEMLDRMKRFHAPITDQTNLWRAWLGFNGSHSSGAIFFGSVNLMLAWSQPDWYASAWGLQVLNLMMLGFYIFLAKKFWFKLPLIGISLSSLFFLIGNLLLWV